MRKHKISLDFTSLLDIMMIILFFFLINFKFSADESKAEAAAELENANIRAEQLEEDRRRFEEEKEEWKKEAEREMDKLREADKNAAANAEALLNFQKGIFLELKLSMSSRSDWSIEVRNGNISIGSISSENSQNLYDEIILILENNGFKKDDVIIAIFTYNLHDIGSGNIPEDFRPTIMDINNEYKNFYCAEKRQ